MFTLSGDRVQEIPFDATDGNGSVAWSLIKRNGQEITSGVYLYSVEIDRDDFAKFIGCFVVIR